MKIMQKYYYLVAELLIFNVIRCRMYVGNRPPQSWRGAQKAAGRALVEKASR